MIPIFTMAQNDADPVITSFGLKKRNLQLGEFNNLSLFFLNNGSFTNLHPGVITLELSFADLKLNSSDLVIVEGPTSDLFTWNFDKKDQILRGILRAEVLPGQGGEIDVLLRIPEGSKGKMGVTLVQTPEIAEISNYNSKPMPPVFVSTKDSAKENRRISVGEFIPFSDIEMNLYPNPVRDILTIKGVTDGKIQLINNTGYVVFRSNHIPSEGIDLINIPTGIYLLKITDKYGSSKVRKVVKQ